VTYGFGELDDIVLVYATTIHKSQSPEYAAVVIPLTTQHYPMLQRVLLYTAVTRGKRTPRKTYGVERVGMIPYPCDGRECGDDGAARFLRDG
jgi:hypothetical protein